VFVVQFSDDSPVGLSDTSGINVKTMSTFDSISGGRLFSTVYQGVCVLSRILSHRLTRNIGGPCIFRDRHP